MAIVKPAGNDSVSVFVFQASVVEVLEGERRKWEACEWERRGMFSEDEVRPDSEIYA